MPMNPEVFRQETITTLELDIERLKSDQPLDKADLFEIKQSLEYCASNIQIIIDNTTFE